MNTADDAVKIGVLALQGGFRRHRESLQTLGVSVVEVRTRSELDDVEALVLPGGESTAISRLILTSGLQPVLAERIGDGTLATFGTCAGMILSARDVLDGVPEQQTLGHLDVTVRRNAIGRQVASFEVDLDVKELDQPFHAVFIRSPVVESVGEDVEVLAEWEGRPVLCRQGRHLFATFHPELTTDVRIHRLFLERL